MDSELIHFNYSPFDFFKICEQFNNDNRITGIIINNSFTILRLKGETDISVEKNGVLSFGNGILLGYIPISSIYSIRIY